MEGAYKELLISGNIYLLGLMGSGKTYLGERLAKKLDMKFLDTDQKIKRMEDMSIPEIFSREGEEYFREIETEALKEISSNSGFVVATGGGTVIKKENRELIRESGKSVFLNIEPRICSRRIKDAVSRPLLSDDFEDNVERLRSLYEKRKSYYLRADLEVRPENNRTEETLEKILEGLNEICGKK